MKRVMIILVMMVIVLGLSGCERKKQDIIITGVEDVIEYECWREGNTQITVRYFCIIQDTEGTSDIINVSSSQYHEIKSMYLQLDDDSIYYTQEEVDLIVSELELELNKQIREVLDLLYSDYVEYDEFDEMLYSNCMIVDGIKHCDIVFNINEYQDLLERIEELESE